MTIQDIPNMLSLLFRNSCTVLGFSFNKLFTIRAVPTTRVSMPMVCGQVSLLFVHSNCVSGINKKLYILNLIILVQTRECQIAIKFYSAHDNTRFTYFFLLIKPHSWYAHRKSDVVDMPPHRIFKAWAFICHNTSSTLLFWAICVRSIPATKDAT